MSSDFQNVGEEWAIPFQGSKTLIEIIQGYLRLFY